MANKNPEAIAPANIAPRASLFNINPVAIGTIIASIPGNIIAFKDPSVLISTAFA